MFVLREALLIRQFQFSVMLFGKQNALGWIDRAIMSSNPKARRYTRVDLPKGMLVAWEHSGIRKVSRVNVLAVGGLFISTPAPPPQGDTIRMVFEVPGGEVRARAIVRDSRPNKGMGVEFTAMGHKERALLNRLIKVLTRI